MNAMLLSLVPLVCLPDVDVSNIEQAAQDHPDHVEPPDLLMPPYSPVLDVESDMEDTEVAPPSMHVPDTMAAMKKVANAEKATGT